MMSAEKQLEITKLGMEAAFGYAKAAINATFEVTTRSMAMWTELAQAVAPHQPAQDETWEWSGAPRRPRSALFPAEPAKPSVAVDPFAVWSALFQASGRAWFERETPSPFAWWAWTPQSAIPATWPWAYGMISSGVPGSVAWPMAEANVALLDAARKTAEATQAPFPAYHSGNGFVGQIWPQPELIKTMLAAAPAATMMWPWLERAA
jgi:hypothetical protein